MLIDNSLSADCTVIEASGLDREGLLFELTNAISKLNLNIVSAQVTTFGERAVDTFYVKDLTGDKILSPWRQGTIRRNLIEAFARADRQAHGPRNRAATLRFRPCVLIFVDSALISRAAKKGKLSR